MNVMSLPLASLLQIPEVSPHPELNFPTVTSEAADMVLVSAAVLFFVAIVMLLTLWWFREYFKETIVSLKPLCEIPDDEGGSGET